MKKISVWIGSEGGFEPSEVELAKQKGKNGRIGEWYKRVDLGREIGQIIFEHWSEIDQSTKLFQTVSSMIEWVKNL